MAKGETRSAARLAAVQALYQMDVAGAPLPDTLAQFESHWLGKVVDGDEYKPADAAFFRDLVAGVLKQQRALDPQIDRTLQGGWPLKRVEAIMRAIFRAGAYELGKRRDVPVRVIITEYVDIAHAFFEKDEAAMVNAVLDALAREVRAEDFAKGA
ncbi:transcription antitermination factor NusB [Chelatococcus sambhunathii]|uniref:Transcription antitermination protein NusB n=1 Tax=Chelatococcus sambhunathii TaxID=363953 RepID=A0ABU1DAK5_9HYPH|nr:transcription antitermination factor NusB [Chelatococcus sambhunathii]MDR4305145.1 transcription antitermination factor NusB [Chelatococcus sambhunathii]